MAREIKKLELRPVDDSPDDLLPVIRITNKKIQEEKSVRLGLPEVALVTQRLEVPAREDLESRTHPPSIKERMDKLDPAPDLLEQGWAKDTTHHQNLPWGWFILVGILLAAAVIWSLYGVKKADVQAKGIQVATKSIVVSDVQEDQEASDLIDRIEATTRKFFMATNILDLVPLVRHPERVMPLMQAHYGDKPIPVQNMTWIKTLEPVNLDNPGNFWMEKVEFANHKTCNLLIEVLDSGEPRIDWEALVCYQPMKWDTFASERPESTTLDFRVYAEEDTFFSHEFSDSAIWSCFRLTALGSEETLFGYAKKSEQTSRDILEIFKTNEKKRTSIILRVNIPEGLQSRRGVVIEKMLSPRWIYLDPPDSGS